MGTAIEISVDALPGHSIGARVAQVVPVSNADTRTFLVRATIDNKAAQLAPGMSVSAQLRVGTARDAEVVPRDALIRYSDGRTTVWVTEIDGDRFLVAYQQ